MKHEEKLWLFIILLIALVLRFWCFMDWSLSNDELSAIHRLDVGSLSELLKKSVWVDGHPAATQIFLYYWTKFFGNTPFILRLPFAIMSGAGIYFFYRCGKMWFNHKAACYAAAIIACSQYFICYGSVARPYAMGFFLISIFSFLWTIIVLQKKHSKLLFVAFSISAAVGIMTHYFAALTIFLQLFLGLFYLNKNQYKAYLLSLLGIALLCLPHLGITLNHLSIKGLSWLPMADLNFFSHTFFLLFNQSYLWILLILISPFILSIRQKPVLNLKNQSLFILLFSLPIIIGLLYSYYRSPVLHSTVLFFCLPFFIIFLSSFIPKESNPKVYRLIILLLITSGCISSGIFTGSSSIKKQFIDFKGVAEKVINLEKEKSKAGILHFSNANHPDYLSYYTKRLSNSFTFDYDHFTQTADIAKVKTLIDHTNAAYISVSHASVPVFPEVNELIKERFGKEVYYRKGSYSAVRLYERGLKKRKLLYEANFNKNKSKYFYFNETDAVDSSKQESSSKLAISPINEFPLSFSSKLGLVSSEINRWISVDFKAKSKDSLSVQLVIELQRNDQSIYWRSYNIRGFYENNQYYDVKRVIERPNFAKDEDQLKLFLWNADKEYFSINDFSIRNFADSKYNYSTTD